jgi:hypothetical protein
MLCIRVLHPHTFLLEIIIKELESKLERVGSLAK